MRIALQRDSHSVGATLTRRNGSFRLRARAQLPGTYQASFVDVVSNTEPVRVRPLLTARIVGTALVGGPLADPRHRPPSWGKGVRRLGDGLCAGAPEGPPARASTRSASPPALSRATPAWGGGCT